MIMAGIGMSNQDIMKQTGLSADVIIAVRAHHGPTIAMIREKPTSALIYLERWRRENALVTGFALSHSPKLKPSDLPHIARPILAGTDTATPPRRPTTGDPGSSAGVVQSMSKPQA